MLGVKKLVEHGFAFIEFVWWLKTGLFHKANSCSIRSAIDEVCSRFNWDSEVPSLAWTER